MRGMVGCVSLDLWMDIMQVQYMGVLLHIINKMSDGNEQREIYLACRKVDEKHITVEVVQQ